jgi:hypothetical protein
MKRLFSGKGKPSDNEERCLQMLFELIPNLPSTVERMVSRVEAFDGKSPRTLMGDIRDDFNALANTASVTQPQITDLVSSTMNAVDLKGEAKRFTHHLAGVVKAEAAADARYSLLLKLMHKADERIPFVSLIVPLRHGDPEAALPGLCYSGELLQKAETEDGEARATTTLRALAATAEYLYKPYVITVWQLSYLVQGEHPGTPPDFGELVKAAYKRLSNYPGLVEPDAGWMRNSAVHQIPDYDRTDDSLTLRDRNTQPFKVQVDALLDMVRRMYVISGNTITRVSQLYLFRELFLESGMLEVMLHQIPSFLSADNNSVASAEKEVMDYAQELMTPLQQWFASHN